MKRCKLICESSMTAHGQFTVLNDIRNACHIAQLHGTGERKAGSFASSSASVFHFLCTSNRTGLAHLSMSLIDVHLPGTRNAPAEYRLQHLKDGALNVGLLRHRMILKTIHIYNHSSMVL